MVFVCFCTIVVAWLWGPIGFRPTFTGHRAATLRPRAAPGLPGAAALRGPADARGGEAHAAAGGANGAGAARETQWMGFGRDEKEEGDDFRIF